MYFGCYDVESTVAPDGHTVSEAKHIFNLLGQVLCSSWVECFSPDDITSLLQAKIWKSVQLDVAIFMSVDQYNDDCLDPSRVEKSHKTASFHGL